MALGELLRQLRAERQVTLEDAGRAMNMSREAYFETEKGRQFPDRDSLNCLAQFYGVSPRIFDRYSGEHQEQLMIQGGIRELEHLLSQFQATYGASERPFKVVESDDIKARIEALKSKLKA